MKNTKRKFLIQITLVSTMFVGALAHAAEPALFEPKVGEQIGYYQDLYKDGRELFFTPYNQTVEKALEKLAANPSYIDELIEKIYPAVSKSKIIYLTRENLRIIKDRVRELNGELPTLKQVTEWGAMKDQEEKEVPYKVYANAAIAFQNAERIKSAISLDIDAGVSTTVDRLRAIVSATMVYSAGAMTALPSKAQSVNTELVAQAGDIVSIAVQAKNEGFEKVYAVVAADKENVNGSPFDGVKNTVDESLAYCAPQLVFVNIMAALGRAYPNPGAIVIPGIDVVRKAKAKINPHDRSEATVFENLKENIQLSFIFAPAIDLRDKIKADLEIARAGFIENNEAEIKLSPIYTEATEGTKDGILLAQKKIFSGAPLNKLLDAKRVELRNAWLAAPDNKAAYSLDLDARIDLFFRSAEEARADCLIFPAWGAGVFMNRIEDIYAAMQRRLEKGSSVKRVIFSTFLPEHELAFNAIFGTQAQK